MEDTVQFEKSASVVFDALKPAVSQFRNMKLARFDTTSRRAEVNVSMNLTSWGETIAITVLADGDSRSTVQIKSFQRLFSMTGRRQQVTHISDILEALGKELNRP